MRTRATLSLAFCAACVATGLAFASDATKTAASGAKKATTPTAATAPASHPAHSKASTASHTSKEEVMALQKALADDGLYKGKIDGVVGHQTKAAIKAYQKNNHLQMTGKADPETLAKLGIATGTQKTAASSSSASMDDSKK